MSPLGPSLQYTVTASDGQAKDCTLNLPTLATPAAGLITPSRLKAYMLPSALVPVMYVAGQVRGCYGCHGRIASVCVWCAGVCHTHAKQRRVHGIQAEMGWARLR